MPAVYLDHNATTPLDPRARAAMLPWLEGLPSNPSSVHRFGQAARQAVETARRQVAAAIGGRPEEVVFVSSGTEANNAVVQGQAWEKSPGRVVLSSIEHPSTQAACNRLQAAGWDVERVPPDASGVVGAEDFAAALSPETSLACLMLANNEVGTIQPVGRVAASCRELGVPVLCDAVQAVGKMAVDVGELGVDFLVLGGHKFHGPLGAAALWVREPGKLTPFLVGGGQERGRRAGTENVAAIVGLGVAAELASRELEARRAKLAALRDTFESAVRSRDGIRIHGADAPRLPNTSNVSFRDLAAEALMIRLDLAGFAVSAGAACSAGKVEASATLTAMGLSESEALSSIRVSFGMTNEESEVEALLATLAIEVERLRGLEKGAWR